VKGLMDEKGQSAIEVVIIAIVLLGMVLATVILTTQRNIDTGNLAEYQRNTAICNGLSSTITNLGRSQGYSETIMPALEKQAKIVKGISGSGVGSVLIEGARTASCNYSGNAMLEGPEDFFVEDEDPGGFTLLPRKDLETTIIYKAKNTDAGVVFCDSAETWC